MGQLTDLVRFVVVLCLGSLLFWGLTAIVVSKSSKRVLFAGSLALSTCITCVLFLLIDHRRIVLSDLVVVVLFVVWMFVIGLLGTFIAPMREGITWEEFVESNMRKYLCKK